jgi:hypothetical protein
MSGVLRDDERAAELISEDTSTAMMEAAVDNDRASEVAGAVEVARVEASIDNHNWAEVAPKRRATNANAASGCLHGYTARQDSHEGQSKTKHGSPTFLGNESKTAGRADGFLLFHLRAELRDKAQLLGFGQIGLGRHRASLHRFLRTSEVIQAQRAIEQERLSGLAFGSVTASTVEAGEGSRLRNGFGWHFLFEDRNPVAKGDARRSRARRFRLVSQSAESGFHRTAAGVGFLDVQNLGIQATSSGRELAGRLDQAAGVVEVEGGAWGAVFEGAAYAVHRV